MKKKYFVIKTKKGEIITNERLQYLVFEYPKQAEKYIEKNFGGSKNLNIKKLQK